PRLLQLAQHHDAEQVADMEARRGTIKADIAGDALASEQLVQARLVGRLMNEAAGLQLAQEIRFDGAHGPGPAKFRVSREPVSGFRREFTGAALLSRRLFL